jgi:uncharacterized protein (TIGR02145 family)
MILRIFCAIAFFVFACSGDPSPVTHGNEVYEAVVIGKQIWLKRNLNYVPVGTDVATNSKCYGDDSENCKKYGKLYDWATAMALPDSCNNASCANQIKIPHRGICPSEWHIPTNAEWEKLLRFVDGTTGTDSPYDSPTAGRYLKATSSWNDYEEASGNGDDTFGFSALPGGICYPDDFYSVGNSGYWWSASEINSSNAFRRGIYYGNARIGHYSYGKNLLLSVRCVRDEFVFPIGN